MSWPLGRCPSKRIIQWWLMKPPELLTLICLSYSSCSLIGPPEQEDSDVPSGCLNGSNGYLNIFFSDYRNNTWLLYKILLFISRPLHQLFLLPRTLLSRISSGCFSLGFQISFKWPLYGSAFPHPPPVSFSLTIISFSSQHLSAFGITCVFVYSLFLPNKTVSVSKARILSSRYSRHFCEQLKIQKSIKKIIGIPCVPTAQRIPSNTLLYSYPSRHFLHVCAHTKSLFLFLKKMPPIYIAL